MNVDELIRGELSAIESYDQVLNKLQDAGEKSELSKMREDHIKALDVLKRYAGPDFKGGAESSGPWGSFTQAFAGGASLFGDKSAVRALKVGEQHGINEYQEALSDQDIGDDLKEVIRSELLPNQERHIRQIDTYLQ